jgi:hypothetical protein
MKKSLIGCVLALALCGLGLLTVAPANADTTCTIKNPGTRAAERVCTANPATAPGAKFVGFVDWWYTGDGPVGPGSPPIGSISGTVTDTDGTDGSCAWVSMEHVNTSGVSDYGPEQVSNAACGKGDTANFAFSFNCPGLGCVPDKGHLLTQYRDGTWKIYIRTNHSSGRFFQQNVATLWSST